MPPDGLSSTVMASYSRQRPHTILDWIKFDVQSHAPFRLARRLLRFAVGALAAQRIRIRIRLPELSTPVPHGFLCQQDTAYSHQLFDIPIAQAEAKAEPDAATDDLRREPMAFREVAHC
jgi:hypothetical protein